MDRTIDILDLAPEVRELVGACELTGKRVLFTRNDRPMVALVSYDEWLALRETIDIAMIRESEEDRRTSHRVDGMPNDRIYITERADVQWQALSDDDREAVRSVLVTIDEDPIAGAPLFEPLRGFWSYRAGALRIIYRIVTEARFILILGVEKV